MAQGCRCSAFRASAANPSPLRTSRTTWGASGPCLVFGAHWRMSPPGETLTIEGIAQGYVDAIDRVLPRHSPVLLCGHSYGAIVALEVAHRLAQGGRRIGFLGVIDTPLRAETRTWMARLQDICRNLPGWLRYDALESDWSSLAARARGKSRDWWRDGLAALGLDLGGKGLGPASIIAIIDGDAITLGGGHSGDGGTDAAAATGDEQNFFHGQDSAISRRAAAASSLPS